MEKGILASICDQIAQANKLNGNKEVIEPWVGLDIRRARGSRHKGLDELELRDFEIIYNNVVMGTPAFPVDGFKKAFQEVIHRFYNDDESDDTEAEERVLVIRDSKVIKAIHFTKDGRQFALTHTESTTDEAQRIFGEMTELKAAADVLLKKQHVKCFERLCVGTLDLKKNGDPRLQVYQPDGTTLPFSGAKIPRDQVLASLWIASQIYTNAPSYRKHMTVEVSSGNYTMGFKANKFYFNQDQLDPFEKDIMEDILRIGNSNKEDFKTVEEYFGTQEISHLSNPMQETASCNI